MGNELPTLGEVKGGLEKLREVARRTYAKEPDIKDRQDAWALEEYLGCIDKLAVAIERADALPPCTNERFEAEKYARNQLAQALYYRGRVDPKTGRLGAFYTKNGEKGVHWDATELSQAASRLACEPLRHIYKATEACMKDAASSD